MSQPIAYDVTHLLSRLSVETPRGIDRVDLAYARYLTESSTQLAAGIQRNRWYTRIRTPEAVAAVTATLVKRWREDSSAEADPCFRVLRHQLSAESRCTSAASSVPRILDPTHGDERKRALLHRLRLGAFYETSPPVPQGAIYLNIAQHGLRKHCRIDWLEQRPDVRAVFFVHDLLPFEFPEFFPPGQRELFERVVTVASRYASGIIASTDHVAQSIERELALRGRHKIMIHVAPLPASGEFIVNGDEVEALARIPYFVTLGTIEPRKNHHLLLSVWRELAKTRGADAPRLIIVGARGWENQHVLAMLERCSVLPAHVIEVTGLRTPALHLLLASARGLLMPSFAEGYGLPIIEALSLGTPVIASDIPVFHQVSQERALFCHPLDGLGWRDTILALTDSRGQISTAARDAARHYRRPMWSDYFAGVTKFLASL